MRTQKTILNLVYALGSSLLLMLLGFATRRLLVFNFGNDITAASQVVDKLFNFFSIAEFGVGSVISYRLYEQIAAKDIEKISKYMSMYKWAYRAVGVVICVLAGIGALALPWIMPGVASGAIMAFTMSLDDFVISYFVSGTDFVTLPVQIYTYVKKPLQPKVYAMFTLLFLLILVLMIVMNLLQARGMKKRSAAHAASK